MYRNRNLTLVFALVAGFLGGFLSHYVTLQSVHAQAQPANAVGFGHNVLPLLTPKVA